MAARYRRESDDGQYNDHGRSRPNGSDSLAGNDGLLDTPPSLEQATDSLELGKGQQELWEEIYKLGVSGVEKYIDLPQIVVVGDQSSGKSSVLEAITGVPFPRSSGMCTKFPTQINLRKAAQQSFSVSLDPDVDRSEAERVRMARFPEMVRGETDLGVIVKRAEQAIWPHGQSAGSASKDTLKLDFSGPKKDYLTLVDLPGIIHTSAGNAMGNEEVVAIRELAIHYMENPRSIILAVISGANDLNLQLVATLARTIDPTGSRTLGVITKPDRIDSPENEDEFIKLAKNEIVKFDLGWHVLRNRSNDREERNCSSKERDLNEKRFFETSRWKVLDQSNLGIDSLKTKMSKLLLQRFAEVIPHVVTQIEQRLDVCKSSLDDLGEGYGTVQQMRSKMQEWCKMSADYVSNAAEGYYRDHYKTSFFDSNSNDDRRRKLRARINAENVRFEEDLRTIGHTVEIVDVHPPLNRRRSRVELGKLPSRMTRAEFVEKMVEPVIRESAGQELLGDSNPLLVYKMFQKQSQNWDTIAARHADNIFAICEEFLREVLDHVWPGSIRERIWTELVEEKLESRQYSAGGEVEMLCKDRCRYAKSYDQEYTNGKNKWERKFLEAGSNPETGTVRPLTPAEGYLVKVLAYYEVTSKVFMSNVIVQVIERHLVDSLEDIFDASRVHEMGDEKVKAIFEEDENIRDNRAKLQAERLTLEGGLKSARRLATRKDLKVHDKRGPEQLDISPRLGPTGLLNETSTSLPQSTGQGTPPLPSRPARQSSVQIPRQVAVALPESENMPSRAAPNAPVPYQPGPAPRNPSTRSTNSYQQMQSPPQQQQQQQQYATPRDSSPPSPARLQEYYNTTTHRPPPVPPYVSQPQAHGQNSRAQAQIPDRYHDEQERERRFTVASRERR